jgi:hypothetical protein
MTSRGLRNNNALNLRPSGDNWKGLRTEQTDPGYLQFISDFYGLRAGAMNLLTYYRVHGRRTVHDIISAWAPQSDNNPTVSYIDTVCKGLGVGSRDLLDLETADNLRRLMEVMIQVECGSQPFTREQLDAAIRNAYASHRARPVNPTVDNRPEPAPVPLTPAPTPPPVPAQPTQPVSPARPAPPRDEIVPAKPPLVDQPTLAPTRKVVVGGMAGAIAFMLTVAWNRMFPANPIPAEYSTEIAGALILGVTLVTQYFVRNRATDVPPAPPPPTTEVKS